MVDRFKKSGKLGCFMAIRPPLTYHTADIDAEGEVHAMRSWDRADLWINGGFFLLRPEIFEYMHEGEELVVEPFQRLIEAGQLMAYRHEGFWRSMDTLKDRQILEEMVEQGNMPWLLSHSSLKRKRVG
jgi:glucose-1-phosphate cytidylyltransferase